MGSDRADKFTEKETSILRAHFSVMQRDKKAISAAIGHSRKEIQALKQQISSLEAQRRVRAEQLTRMKEYATKGLALQQRVEESQLAVSLLERDTQDGIASLARARRNLEQSERDLSMLTLQRKTKIQEELADIAELIAKNRASIDGSRRLVQRLTGLPSFMSSLDAQVTIKFEILRRKRGGDIRVIEASETTLMLADDVLRVRPQLNKWKYGKKLN